MRKIKKDIEKKIKILLIFSNIDYAKEFYWFAKYINREKFNPIFLFLNPEIYEIEKQISDLGFTVYHINYENKKNLLSAIFKTILLILKEKPKIIHSQLFDATIVGNISAILTFKKNIIITRHHSDYHHVYFPKAVFYDRIINFLSKKIIVPSSSFLKVFRKEKTSLKKVIVIYHGFDFEEMENVSTEKLFEIRKKYEINSNYYPIIGVISRFTHWKGIQYIIPAFKKLLNLYQNSLLILANAVGDYEQEILKLLREIPSSNYRIIKFEPEIYCLYKSFHVFVHVPIRKEAESFGQVYVEALFLEVPSIFTLSGIAAEFKIFQELAEIVDYKNSEQIYNKLLKILNNYSFYKNKLRNSKEIIKKMFSFDRKINQLQNLYMNLCVKN